MINGKWLQITLVLCIFTLLVIPDSFGQENQQTQNENVPIDKVPPVLDFTVVLALLLIYYIPAQFIERILELLKITTPTDDDLKNFIFRNGLDEVRNKINNLKVEIDFFQGIRTKINEKKTKQFETNYTPNFSKKDVDNWLKCDIADETKSFKAETTDKPNLTLDEFYELDTKKIDKLISFKQVLLSKEQQRQAVQVWILSLAMAIAPAMIFSYYQIGLLQILGISNLDGQIIDAAINVLFIGSGTKPIHDIMKKLSVTQTSLLDK